MAWTCYCYRRSQKHSWCEDWRFWKDGNELWTYVDGLAWEGKPIIVVGHNVFFDLTVSGFFTFFTDHDWVRTFYYDKGLTYILCLRKSKAKLKIISSTNYFPASLKEMGDAVGKPKLDVDPLRADFDTTTIYCFRDVEILVDYILQYVGFVKNQDLGSFRLTRASQAMSAYRHRFKPSDICLHTEDDIRQLECDAYYGGRTEAFAIGDIKGGPFLSLDVNSMYPYVMKHYPMPTKLLDVTYNPKLSRVDSYLKRFLCVAQVLLDTTEPLYAVRTNGKIVFPIGQFRTYVCTDGLREARKRGHLKAVETIALYRGGVIFSDYVDYFYAMRQNAVRTSDPLTAIFAKYCMNSLYGKFGQYLEQQEDIGHDPEERYTRYEIYDQTTGEREIRVIMLNSDTAISGKQFAEQSFYAIPAHVTEAARMILWRIIESVGYSRVLYCDTDSVKIRKRDLFRVKHPIDAKALGALKIERTSNRLSIYGLKDYREDDLVHIKGVPRTATEIAPGVFRFTCWLRQSSHLRLKAEDHYITVDMTRTLKRKYDKGVVHENGRITPLVLHEE